jgi:DNA-binding LytR/AlgR family response regulator
VAAHGLEELARSVDVMFIDVRLNGSPGNVDGLQLAREIAAIGDPPLLVFATASRAHALDAIDLGSIGYLRKPFDEARLGACLARVRERRRPTRAPSVRRLVGRSRTGLVFLDPEEVWAFEADARVVAMHAATGSFDIDLSLSSVSLVLGERFMRVHRQWLIQLKHARALERRSGEHFLFVGEAVGGRGLWVPVARDRSAEVRQALLAFSAGLRL